MKKVLLITMMLISNIMLTHAQDIYHIDIESHPSNQTTCKGDGAIFYVYAQTGCEEYEWFVNGEIIEKVSPIIITPTHNSNHIHYFGCEGFEHEFYINYVDATVPESFTQIVWGHPGIGTTLIATLEGYSTYNWQGGPTGPNSYIYEVFAQGTYICDITNPCGSATQTFIRYDMVEIYRATIDLETNLNKVTWSTTPKQTEYISEMKVYRDGMLVGTAPYEQGYFLDNIGSDNAARNYHLVSVSIDGEESPVSDQKGTIHTTYYQDVNNNLNMTWNIPFGTQGILTYFQICKYDPATGDLTVVDQVNAAITDYTCGVNQFDGGYAVIAAVFNDGKGVEELSFSNLTTDILGLGENGETAFRIYPNPAKGHFTVAGNGTMRITNVLGQEIMTKEIHETETVELPTGMYFVTLNGNTRKIVVE